MILPQPIKRISSPSYPTRREFLAKGTVFLLAAGCGGCGYAAAYPIVAPIFEHGEGHGAEGCVVMTAPVFLSEEEAMQIIKEELSKEGIQLGANMPLPEVSVRRYIQQRKWLGHPELTELNKDRHAVLGAVDREHKIGVEFVSKKESLFNFKNLEELSSGLDYPTKQCAIKLADAIAKNAAVDLRIGIFYDPVAEFDIHGWYKEVQEEESKDKEKAKDKQERYLETRNRWEETAKVKSKDLLRRQAQDFIAWLKKQENQ